MGKNCAVIGCSNSTVKIYKWRTMPCVVHEGKIRKECGCWLDPPYKLFCFPSQLKNLDARKRWIRCLKRENKDKSAWNPGVSDRICSFHFADGVPTVANPDPTINMINSLAKANNMTKEIGCQSPVNSPGDEQYKSKRGRKPSQAKLAMLEPKKLFAEKKRFLDTDDDGSTRKKKKKIVDDTKKNSDSHTSKLKKKKNSSKVNFGFCLLSQSLYINMLTLLSCKHWWSYVLPVFCCITNTIFYTCL